VWLVGELANDIPWYSRRTDVVGLLLWNTINYIQRIIFHVAFLLHEKLCTKIHKSLHNRVDASIALYNEMLTGWNTDCPPSLQGSIRGLLMSREWHCYGVVCSLKCWAVMVCGRRVGGGLIVGRDRWCVTETLAYGHPVMNSLKPTQKNLISVSLDPPPPLSHSSLSHCRFVLSHWIVGVSHLWKLYIVSNHYLFSKTYL